MEEIINNNKKSEQQATLTNFDVFKDNESILGDSDVKHIDDPLLDSLVILTKLEHHPFSADALRAGLPLVDNRLTPELFSRAAKRAGFKSHIVQRPLHKVPSIVLPAVIILKNNQACVLESLDIKNNTATVIQPVANDSVHVNLTVDELKEQYAGFTIFVNREFSFDNRTSETIKTHNKHWFWGTVWQSKKIYRDVLLASFFINLFVIATPIYIRTIYDRVIPNNAIETLWVISIGVALIFFFEFILKTLRGHFIDVAGKKADIILSSLIFEKVMALRMEVRPESIGAFSDNIKAFESVRNFMTSATLAVFIDVPFFVLFLFVIYLFAGAMVYIPLIAMLIIIAYGLIVRLRIRTIIEKNFRISLHKNATLIETLSSVETIKTMGAEGYQQRKWEESVGSMADFGLKLRMLNQSVGNFSTMVTQASTIAVMIIGIGLISTHALSAGSLILCMMLSRRAISPMAKVATLIATYQQTKTAFDSLDAIMQLPVERADNQKFIHRPQLRGKIEFKNVDFKYPNQDVYALKNINLIIEPGDKIAFIGRIGSGKTTLEKLILGLYQTSTGQIRVDGVEIGQIDPADLRRNIGYVAQDITLFHGTVRDNICYKAPYVADHEILRVAEIAGVTDFTNRHPLGFDMPVKERGEGLSGGQRQSIAIARALLLNPPVLIMDEPSNSMDNNTEAELKAKLLDEIGERTLILITHRASLLSLVDRIIVLDNGEIIADGQKEQVLEALKQGRLKIRKN
ncbi:MAG: type I secretion system permease/ATPase [Pseudomonadota bacterium]